MTWWQVVLLVVFGLPVAAMVLTMCVYLTVDLWREIWRGY